MQNITPSHPKTKSEIRLEWDRLAQERHHQIITRQDVSFDHVLAPFILRQLQSVDTTCVVDIGSGTGDLTKKICEVADKVIGVEASKESVEVARKLCSDTGNVHFYCDFLESLTDRLEGYCPTCAVAAMTLMTTPDIKGFAGALVKILGAQATFIATLTHPCFWPRYWGYDRESWFKYSEEQFIEAPFTISHAHTDKITTHIHRPLSTYLNAFSDVGFVLEEVVEPIPTMEIQALYPQPWEYPRFIGVRWRRSFDD